MKIMKIKPKKNRTKHMRQKIIKRLIIYLLPLYISSHSYSQKSESFEIKSGANPTVVPFDKAVTLHINELGFLENGYLIETNGQ